MFVFIEGIYLVNSNTNVVVVSKNCRVPLLTRTFFGWHQCPFFPPLFLCPLLLTKSWPQFCFTPSQWNHSQTKPSQTKPNTKTKLNPTVFFNRNNGGFCSYLIFRIPTILYDIDLPWLVTFHIQCGKISETDFFRMLGRLTPKRFFHLFPWLYLLLVSKMWRLMIMMMFESCGMRMLIRATINLCVCCFWCYSIWSLDCSDLDLWVVAPVALAVSHILPSRTCVFLHNNVPKVNIYNVEAETRHVTMLYAAKFKG